MIIVVMLSDTVDDKEDYGSIRDDDGDGSHEDDDCEWL